MDRIFQILISIGIAISITIPTIYWIQKRFKERSERRKKAFDELIGGLSTGITSHLILCFTDFKDFILGSEQLDELNYRFPHSFEFLILRVKHVLIQNQKIDERSQEIIENIKEEVKSFIEQAELRDPFKNVPSSERNLLIDILELSNLKSNTVFVSKLHELGNLIRTKDELFIKTGKDNEESLRLAKQSKILAIVFFVVSLVLAIYSIWK